MLASTTLTWTLLIASLSPDSSLLQAMTSIQGFGSQEACLAAGQITQQSLPDHVQEPLLLCLPVDAAKPLPSLLLDLVPQQK